MYGDYYDPFDCEITCEEYWDDLSEWETEQAWRDGLAELEYIEDPLDDLPF